MTAVAEYIAALDRAHRRGDATEHSYRRALKVLLEIRAPNIEATNEPQRIAGNAPDFVVRRGATILGHVEAKDIGEPLDKLLKSPQLKRYVEALPNLIFTDYLDFIWIEHGVAKLRVRLAEETPRGIAAVVDAEVNWNTLAQAFYNAVAPTVATPRQLAHLLAAQTRLLRDATLETLKHEGEARQYFGGIDPETWAFRIGGYQVLEKWLKDRKGRALDIDDITHYRKVAIALARTRQLMKDIDAGAAPLFVKASAEEMQ